MMAYLIAVIFDNEDEASQVRDTLRKGQKQDLITLEDSAIAVRDADGKLHVKNEVDRGVKIGALWGSVIGLLIGGLFFPFFGLALGALGGAGVGKMLSDNVSKDFVKEVGEEMQPGSSAIFYIFRHDNVDAAVAAMRPYQGKVIHTTISSEAEAALRDELKKRIK
jgi:uncharacterized membrane protein